MVLGRHTRPHIRRNYPGSGPTDAVVVVVVVFVQEGDNILYLSKETEAYVGTSTEKLVVLIYHTSLNVNVNGETYVETSTEGWLNE